VDKLLIKIVTPLLLIPLGYRGFNQSSAQASDVGASSGSEMFGQNQVAMVIEGNWAIPYLKEIFPQIDFATAEVPKINH